MSEKFLQLVQETLDKEEFDELVKRILEAHPESKSGEDTCPYLPPMDPLCIVMGSSWCTWIPKGGCAG